MPTKAEFEEILLTQRAEEICRTYIFSSDIWLLNQGKFPDPISTYDEIKAFFAKKLKVSNLNIAIVGSSKMGFSLNPKNPLRDFNSEDSDIDLAIVSSDLFGRLWEDFLKIFYSSDIFVGHWYRKAIFQKYIWLTKNDNFPSEDIKKLQKQMGESKRDFFATFQIANEINYRIYESWEAAEAYHIWSMEKLKGALRDG